MDNCYGQHGWKEFHRNRKDILSEFDKILEQIGNRPVQTEHGPGVEAYIRKWLAEFLPKRFGVTSGFVIPDVYNDDLTIYHYDIIIYDVLNAPVLWTQGNADNSDQGKYRAIPARHVMAIYEVKSRLTKKNVKDALEKLDEMQGFSDQLNANYHCAAIFVDLKEADNKQTSILEELFNGKDVFRFSGGMVLRYEGDDSCTGHMSFHRSEVKEPTDKVDDLPPTKAGLPPTMGGLPMAKPIDTLDIRLTEDGSLVLGEVGSAAKLLCTASGVWSVSKSYGLVYSKEGLTVRLDWSRSNFANFCIDVLSRLEGRSLTESDRPKFGQIFDNVERKKAPLQNPAPIPGSPFISLSLRKGGPNGEKMVVTHGEDKAKFEFWFVIDNLGDADATISDDQFKTSCVIPAKGKANRYFTLECTVVKTKRPLADVLATEPLEIPYRLVYRPTEGEKSFVAVERSLNVCGPEVALK